MTQAQRSQLGWEKKAGERPAFFDLKSRRAAGGFLHQFGDETLEDTLIDVHILLDDRAFAKHAIA